MKQMVLCFTVLLLLSLFVSTVLAEQALKDFTFETLDGKTIHFNTLKGFPLVINVGATW